VLTTIPRQIVSGHQIIFTQCFEDYKPADWTLSYHLRGAAALDVNAATQDADTFLVTLTASSGSPLVALPAGQYYYQAYVTNVSTPSDKRLVTSGRVVVVADLSDTSLATYDGRSQAEKILEAIDAVMAGKATRDQASYTIGQRTLVRIPVDQLMEMRKTYVAVIQQERIAARKAAGLSPFENILTEFRTPGQTSRHKKR
jgi:hypothetical protein